MGALWLSTSSQRAHYAMSLCCTLFLLLFLINNSHLSIVCSRLFADYCSYTIELANVSLAAVAVVEYPLTGVATIYQPRLPSAFGFAEHA